MTTAQAIETSDREIVIIRTFDAPPEQLWRAWSDPASIVQWWGPEGFTTTSHALDFRPGGDWRFDMHGPDGRDYPNRITYREIDRPRRIVYAHAGDEDVEPVRFETTVTFEAQANRKTKLTLKMVFPSAGERDRVVKEYGAVEGGIQTVGRLAEHLAKASGGGRRAAMTLALPSEREISLTRVFDAPRNLVFKAFTTPEILKQWMYGNDEWPLAVCEINLKVGGELIYVWRHANGTDMTMRGVFREVVPPERLVHTELFDDAWNGEESLVTTVMVERAGRTTVTSTMSYASRVTREAVIKSGMANGVAKCYDQLEAMLAAGEVR